MYIDYSKLWKLLIDKNIDKDSAISNAKNDERVAEVIVGKTIVKEIYVPGKIVNIVVK